MQASMQQRVGKAGISGRATNCPTSTILPAPVRLQQAISSTSSSPLLLPVSQHRERLCAARSTPETVALHQEEPRAASSSGSNGVDKSVSTSSVGAAEKSQIPDTVPSTSAVWEIDFCSRPLLDERGKKVWELLICDPERTFEYSEFFPNSRINSGELKRAIESILSRPGSVRPEKARFFRSQMQTIISKALTECDIKPVPSRRCFTVMSWIQERLETVYKQDPRYSDKAQSLFQLDLGPPEPLPDALRGEQWAFVQIPLRTLLGMLRRVEEGEMFGSTFDLKTIGADKLPKDILIPGVAVFSRRALPLSAWTNGLEIAAVKADVARSSLILETGVINRWRYGGWRTNQDAIDEAENWEDCKQGVMGLHFLAVQPDPDSEELSGLWLLVDRAPPAI